MKNSLTVEQKRKIKALLANPTFSLKIDAYRFGKGNSKTHGRLDAAKIISHKIGIPEELGFIAMEYLNDLIIKKEKKEREKNFRPPFEEWKDGDRYPAWINPINFTKLMFSTLEVTPSGVWRFKKDCIPKWIRKINSEIQSSSKVKQHDIDAALPEEIRRYYPRRERPNKP